MHNPYDQYHDPGFGRLRHLLEEHPRAADMLKVAEIEDDGDGLPASAYAWPAKRLFPIHSADQAAVSYLYAKTASEALPREVLAEIETALDAFDVPRDVFEPVETKVAALEEDECLFPEDRAYPVRSAAEVKLAEERLLAQVGKLLPETRATVFSRLAKFASRHGAPLHPLSAKFAGLTQTDPLTLRTALLGRSGATKQAGLAASYVALADAVAADPRALRDRTTQVKLAEAIGTLDEQDPAIGAAYDRGLPDPLLSVFNTEKRADEAGVDCGSLHVPLAKLCALGPGFYADALGPDVVREITTRGAMDAQKLAQLIPTLPAEMKRSLCQALTSTGHV